VRLSVEPVPAFYTHASHPTGARRRLNVCINCTSLSGRSESASMTTSPPLTPTPTTASCGTRTWAKSSWTLTSTTTTSLPSLDPLDRRTTTRSRTAMLRCHTRPRRVGAATHGTPRTLECLAFQSNSRTVRYRKAKRRSRLIPRPRRRRRAKMSPSVSPSPFRGETTLPPERGSVVPQSWMSLEKGQGRPGYRLLVSKSQAYVKRSCPTPKTA
jgi:hypothetical protein